MSLSAFESQVGGHKGTIQEDESGSILIKSTSPREVDFYQSLAPTLDASFVGKWTPWFYGTLKRQQSLPAEAAEVASQVGLAVPDVQPCFLCSYAVH